MADNKFLEVAKESSADYLITGNFRDFTIDKFDNTNIVSPKYYIENGKPCRIQTLSNTTNDTCISKSIWHGPQIANCRQVFGLNN